MKTVARKSRIVKQLGSPIHSILYVHIHRKLDHYYNYFLLIRYTDNKVFVALSHGELCVFHRDMSKDIGFILRKKIDCFCFVQFKMVDGI